MKFGTKVEEALYTMCSEDWCEDWVGDVTDYGTITYLLINSEQDVSPENGEFMSFLDSCDLELDAEQMSHLVGSFLITENADGIIGITECSSEDAAQLKFQHAQRTFNEWLADRPSEDFFLTFGVKYRHEPHPSKHPVDPDGFVRITARNEIHAREIAFSYYGPAWSQLTPADYWNPYRPDGSPFFQKGEIAHYSQVNPDFETVQGEVL